jgi:peptide/nickel transport system permease protein
MLKYTIHRVFGMVPTLIAISIIIFTIIQLPPGDYLETFIAELQAQGEKVDPARIEFLREQYLLDQPVYVQYWAWISGFVRGDLGFSFEHKLPVSEVIGHRVWLSIIVALTTIVLPNFLLALILLYAANVWFGTSIGGLMDPSYIDQPWSWGKMASILAHLWVPVIVIGTSGTASMIRRLRANLLDELQKQYVITARAKGLSPLKILLKYPLRLALNPFIADIGMILPQIISGGVIVAFVMDLPTTGPMLLDALKSQDMFLAGSFLMFEALLVVAGVLVSDLLLAVLDPRIRLGGAATK